MADIIPVVQGLPAYLQQVQAQPTNLGAGISASAPRLGITITREFTLTKNGQTQILPNRSVRAVILAAAPTLNKAWFSKPFAPGQDVVPDCYSDDGQVPAQGATNKQHSNCSMCPKNAFGSNPVTGRGKACSDRKRVVLALEDDPNTAVVANWPTMSLAGLKNLDMQLQAGRIPLQAVMLEFSFDTTVQYSKILINPVGFVPEEVFRALEHLANLPATVELLRSEVYEDEPPTPAPMQPPAYLAQPTYGAPVAPAQQAVQPAPAQSAPQPVQTAPAQQDPSPVQPAPAQTEAPPVEASRRRRRTKAEMEAARAAEALGRAGVAPAPVQPVVVPSVQPQPAPEPQAAPVFQFPAQPAPTPVQPQPVAQPQVVPPAQPAPQAAANVMDIINRWKSQN